MCDSFPDDLTYDGTFDCADGSWMLKDATCCENQHLAPHLASHNDFPSSSRDFAVWCAQVHGKTTSITFAVQRSPVWP